MKRSRVPTEPELQVEAAPPEQYTNERGKGVASASSYPPWVGDFLKSCYYCHKLLKRGENIFMYRDFCAFCSEECRDAQMEIDETKLKLEKLQKARNSKKSVDDGEGNWNRG